MSDRAVLALLASLTACLTAGASVASLRLVLGGKRLRVVERLRALNIQGRREDDDIMQRPFLDRTLGALVRSVASAVGQATPSRVLAAIEGRLVKAGSPRNMKASGFLTILGVLCPAAFAGSWFLVRRAGVAGPRAALLAGAFAATAGYLPWFELGRTASKRQKEVRLSLPDVMDLLVVSVEAGLAFDMALLRVVEKSKGAVTAEFQKVLREIQLGKPRKEALRDMADRAGVQELGALVSAVIQAEQLGVGIAGVLRLQSDLIREKRQQLIEEQAMKAPVKMLFPLVFLVFPSILVVVLGPAVLNIMKVLSGFRK